MRIILVSTALLATHMAAAATPIDGLYSSVFGGYAYIPNNISRTQYSLTRTDASYQAGFDAGGSIGYKSNPMRYEGELTYLNANIKNFKINGVYQTSPSGYSNAILAMANAYYDFPAVLPSIQPFLGLGLGYAWVNAKLNSEGPYGTTRFTGSNSVFAYQGTAGLTYNFAENYALNVGYRYVATEKADKLGKIFQVHLANVGVIYRFDEGRYK
ncbi:outer membrane protein [Legionella oakridgensis]|uniref:Opacity protein-related surface antigens n=2 Tax=Legionella oakridgensis TaxID=29423 RepID=W0BFS5_9GAMM|nr:outer membrane beta-barrel protein [Legionella oakridgensis]AHE67482.1 opacity protein-related surface antigens [Legionella oakridgensis ATCC 33761 = DSM 21215]ETO93011.1 opacity protein [Legionella oakridgensis RV-2-2007]KTD43539.1 opacity protein-like surface antigen [Legionella oakridgensis]STY20531.1 opacity protein-like surface antigen [Legionella longbeachae]